jgi:hypothetical protein
VIRFSAALVAVAIGVLIGGIATSKLLLVYIAIVVSAVALVALAIGVVLKREELFGDGQGLVPAGAGASPAPPLRADESRGKIAPSAQVPLPVPGAAPGYGVPFGGTAPSAPAAAADLSAPRPAAAGQGRSADPAPPWQAPAARGPWSSSVPDWMPAGQGQRTVGAAGGTGTRAPSAWQDTSAGKAPGGAAGGWSVPAADTQAAATAPRSWAAPPPASVSPDAPPAQPGAGSGATPPSWFDRLGKPADADAPAASSTSAPGSGGGWADSTASGDEDDDWPTRYSWLDDETDESVEARDDAETEAGETVGAGPGPEGKSTAPAGADSGAGTEGIEAAAAVADTSGNVEARGARTAGAGTPDAGIADAAVSEAAEAGAGVAAPDGPEDAGPEDAARLRPASDPDDQKAGRASEAAAESGAEAAGRPGDEPPAANTAAAPGTALVAVVRGVPRYHEPDCVLIRFMPEGDVQKMTIPRAREEGCTPCAACQPEG